MTDLKFVTLETFIVQFIILILIFWILNKFIFKPYLAYLDEMEEKHKKLEGDYKNIDKLISDAHAEKETILSEARAKGEAIVHDSESLGKKKKEEIILKAENDAKNMLSSGRDEIEKERLGMMHSMKSMIASLVLKLNGKIFKENNVTKEFIEQSLNSIKD